MSSSSSGSLPASPLLPDLSTHFDDAFLSDFDVALVTPEQAQLGRYHVHGIVLAGQSAYFKSLLQNWMGSSGDGRLVTITVTHEE